MADHVDRNCKLLSGSFAILIQVLLGWACLGVLGYKRNIERPRRPLKIFALDTSKQVAGALFIHFANIVAAELVGKSKAGGGDECAWYFVYFLADTVIGIPVAYVLLGLLERAATTLEWHRLKNSGDYGTPFSYATWLVQLVSWLFIIAFMKTFTFAVFHVLESPLKRFGIWVMQPVSANPKVELIVVMAVAPGLMNAIQFWCFDNFLKKDGVAVDGREDPLLGDGSAASSSHYLPPPAATFGQPRRTEGMEMQPMRRDKDPHPDPAIARFLEGSAH